MNDEDYKGGFFMQVVKDAIHNMSFGGDGYCFSLDQVEEVKKRWKVYSVREVDGIYYLKGECTNGKVHKKKGSKSVNLSY